VPKTATPNPTAPPGHPLRAPGEEEALPRHAAYALDHTAPELINPWSKHLARLAATATLRGPAGMGAPAEAC
jgi:hypothetical protein